ncbi:DUF317 domain-containing protein [Streptomyces sp. DSM 41972]|uniref:DUF317 domain-containing protein n=1 Tax=Streptomyces althioticus subsp. attaecolombicae TaxID=3075534 RepID=A0ABU3HXJ2_9ACTN|nr:DUF317 domain-containing protein [Streptomyces sp. DSM 41972]SCD64926.1 protein of unknown function [Streptomyces sp. di50b]SCD69817.1 protein of unknown function [Streptomyces sp. di188]
MPPFSDPSRFEEVLVSPLYLAGSNGAGDVGFAPVAHWPHHHLDDGPCQLLVTSPDQRIRIGWFGDDFDLWKITAAEEAVAPPRWTATFNHVTPGEIVAGLTTALAQDYAASDPYENNGRFLAGPSLYWVDAVRPLLDAGWRLEPAMRGTVSVRAPDGQAGALIRNDLPPWDDEAVTLWAGPRGWGTRAEAVFTARTPAHLIAATAAAMASSAPVVRERHMIHREVEHLVTLTPVAPAATPQVSRAPTPLDVRRTAVTEAVRRAARAPRTAADLRVMAAQSRTTSSARMRSSPLAPAAEARPPVASSPRRHSR